MTTYLALIVKYAKMFKVSAVLLTAICTHESANFKFNYSPDDMGTPSYGVCQIKNATAIQLGYNGKEEDLIKPENSIKYAALYLKYQQQRYGDDWCKLASSFNAGSYTRKNMNYVNKVRNKLDKSLQYKLSCNTFVTNVFEIASK